MMLRTARGTIKRALPYAALVDEATPTTKPITNAGGYERPQLWVEAKSDWWDRGIRAWLFGTRIRGTLRNEGPAIDDVQVLVQLLDDKGRAVGEERAWTKTEVLKKESSRRFDVRVSTIYATQEQDRFGLLVLSGTTQVGFRAGAPPTWKKDKNAEHLSRYLWKAEENRRAFGPHGICRIDGRKPEHAQELESITVELLSGRSWLTKEDAVRLTSRLVREISDRFYDSLKTGNAVLAVDTTWDGPDAKPEERYTRGAVVQLFRTRRFLAAYTNRARETGTHELTVRARTVPYPGPKGLFLPYEDGMF